MINIAFGKRHWQRLSVSPTRARLARMELTSDGTFAVVFVMGSPRDTRSRHQGKRNWAVLCSDILTFEGQDSQLWASHWANQHCHLGQKYKSEICTEMESFLYLLEDQGVLCHPFDLVHPSILLHHLTLVHPKCKSKCQFWLLSWVFKLWEKRPSLQNTCRFQF